MSGIKQSRRRSGAIYGNTGRRPHNAIPPSIKEQVIRLASDDDRDYNFSHLSDPLAEEQKIKISDEALRLWLRPRGLGPMDMRGWGAALAGGAFPRSAIPEIPDCRSPWGDGRGDDIFLLVLP